MTITRRALLEQLGRAGGTGAAYMAMELLGLAVPTPVGAETFELPRRAGKICSVVVLGAGIAGLVSAYELKRAGYRVIVIEARDRVGGRSWTIRGGDRIEQMARPVQYAQFERGLYFNAGAARIPGTHRIILGYARRLGVPLETFVNTNRNASWELGGEVQPERRMVEDLRGQIAELLAKAIDLRALDQIVPRGELEVLRDFLAQYGALDSSGRYVPTGSSGYLREPGGYNQAPVPLAPLGLGALLPASRSKETQSSFLVPYLFEHNWAMQPAMLQPIGGMDRIAHGFYEEVKAEVRLNSPVSAIRRDGDRVRIEHGPGQAVTDADYCICTLPLPILARIASDFSAAKKSAIAAAPAYQDSVKVAFESPRFWESEDNIYGGLAWTDRPNENVIYPSGGFNQPTGVLVAAYCAGWTRSDNPQAFAALSHEERFRVCRDSIEALHPGKSRSRRKGVTVDWQLTPFSQGANADWPGGSSHPAKRGSLYEELLRPEGPIVFAGDHLSYQPAWQEGAASSAHAALKLVDAMRSAQGR